VGIVEVILESRRPVSRLPRRSSSSSRQKLLDRCDQRIRARHLNIIERCRPILRGIGEGERQQLPIRRIDFIEIAIERLRLDRTRFVVVAGDQKDLIGVQPGVPLTNLRGIVNLLLPETDNFRCQGCAKEMQAGMRKNAY
jgi:hypothetical protein